MVANDMLYERQQRSGQQGIIVARDAAVQYGKRVIWQHANFSLDEGEFITIVGPNGAGKSTFLRLLLGLLPLSAGEIELFGHAPHKGNPLIGYVPQRRTLDPDLRIRAIDFVKLGLDGHKWGMPLPFLSHKKSLHIVSEALEAVGALSYATRAVGRLSGGEQQRLLLAQALLTQPRILLLDEPLASLDMRNQSVVARVVSQVARQRNMTVLLVSHDVNPLLPFTDRVLYVAEKNVAIGTPDEIITSEQLSRLYQAPIEVVRDSRGRVLVFGQENTIDELTYI
ncbi:MAG TPA: ATP-binding cassette domain-containing protein [Ktedonobacteraceae bacterium]|jgi:zinc/manganese transport system ATP-binding protein